MPPKVSEKPKKPKVATTKECKKPKNGGQEGGCDCNNKQ